MKIIIIGGVAAGMSAASKIKRLEPSAEVVVYEKGGHLSYGACGLPYYVSGENDDHTKMIARTQAEFEANGIITKLHHEVVKIDTENKQVMVKEHPVHSTYIDTYDKLLIATGTSAIIPPFPGGNLENIHVLKTLEDGIRLKEVACQSCIQKVTIVGGGYIGVEVAEAMRTLGKEVRLIELSDRILNSFDVEITKIAEREMINQGVQLSLGERVEGFFGENVVQFVQTDRGTYETDLVLLAIGVKPATNFLKHTGISLSKNGAVIVDREMRTSIEDVYAAGDCAEVYSQVMEENTYIPLGTNANKCGRIAGENILGARHKYVGTLGSAAIKIFDVEAGRTGMSEFEAEKLNIDYQTVFVESRDHPRYYPGASPIWIKLICEKRTKRLLGAQAIGNDGVVLRIDVLAVAIHNRMTADEMGMTDLCYAPPFAGVWDAIHIACNAVK